MNQGERVWSQKGQGKTKLSLDCSDASRVFQDISSDQVIVMMVHAMVGRYIFS